jgi:hypothetical protein
MFAFVFLLATGVVSALPAAAEDNARRLPFWAGLAGDRELPRPWGVSALGYWQDHGYDLEELSATSALDPRIGQVAGMVDPARIDVENEVVQAGIKVDAWVLPFLDVSVLAGYIDGRTEVDFGGLQRAAGAGMAMDPMAQQVLMTLDEGLDFDYAGFLYGAGVTLGWSVGPVFAAVNGIATWAELDDDASARAVIARPILGVRFDRLALWTGAMYQDAQERHKGTISVPGLGAVSYDVRLEEKEPWNWLLGTSYAFSDEWQLALEGGIGERTQVEAALTRRF